MLRKTFSAINFFSHPTWNITNTLSYKYNVLIVSHEITGPNMQTSLTMPNKPSHKGRGLTLIPFVITRSLSCRYYSLSAQKGPDKFKKHAYKVKRSS